MEFNEGLAWKTAETKYCEFIERKIWKGELKPAATRVFFWLKSFSSDSYEPVSPSIRMLMEKTWLARQSVINGIGDLAKEGIIRIQKQSSLRGGRQRNIYYFNVAKFRDER